MGAGKYLRMQRLIEPASGTCIICALDHGMTSPVFLVELADLATRTGEAIAGGANVIMMSPGMIARVKEAYTPLTSFAMLLSASSRTAEEVNRIVQVGTVEEALRLGADAVVVYVALGGHSEPEMIRFVSETGDLCDRYGMPFIAEAEYPTTYQSLATQQDHEVGYDYLARNVRLCAELGADIIKTNWPGSQEQFAGLVEAAGGIPVVLAGGSRIDDAELLTRMQLAREVGAVGCSVGRNIFQHRVPAAITRALSRVVRDRWSAQDALAELQQASPVSAQLEGSVR